MAAGAFDTSLKLFQFQFRMAKAAGLRVMEQYRKMGLGIRSLDSSGSLPLASLLIVGKSKNIIP